MAREDRQGIHPSDINNLQIANFAQNVWEHFPITRTT